MCDLSFQLLIADVNGAPNSPFSEPKSKPKLQHSESLSYKRCAYPAWRMNTAEIAEYKNGKRLTPSNMRKDGTHKEGMKTGDSSELPVTDRIQFYENRISELSESDYPMKS